MDQRRNLSAIARMVRSKTHSQVIPNSESAPENLAASDLPRAALQPGQSITDFELPDVTGRMVNSVDLRANGPMLVVFYCGFACPFCRLMLKRLEARCADLQDLGVTPVAISGEVSPQTADQSLTTKKESSLKFPVLSDSGNKAARQFGIVFILNEAFKEGDEEFGIYPPIYIEDNSFLLPGPSTFLISTDGTILSSFMEVDDYLARLAQGTAFPGFD
jgi:peroxiredoxin